MKVRRSFVTNSSSSSFLMGTMKDNITKDIVFRVICELYKEYYGIRERIMQRLGEYPGMFWDENYQGFEIQEREDVDWLAVSHRFEEEFGIFTWSHFGYDVGWWDLNTYQEYQAYWEEKRKTNTLAYEPFTIVDYSQGERDDCLFGESIFSWYVKCDGRAKRAIPRCETCSMEFDDEKCREYRRGVQEGSITKKNRMEAFLGKLCVESWEGEIPYYVAEKLSTLSRFSCIHMG